MSLLEAAMEPFVMLDKNSEADGYGGVRFVWSQGAEFMAATTYDTSIEARIAGVQGAKSLYTVTVNPSVNLKYNDVIKRLRDNKVFRITSDGDDKVTPKDALIKMRQVMAEEYTLPN